MRTKEDWLYDIQNGRGKDIARAFFKTYFTQEEITKQLYHKAYSIRNKKITKEHFVIPIITRKYKEWNKLNFFDRSPPLNVKYKPKDFTLPILNLEPLYRYCKKKNIGFSQKEKEVLNIRVGSESNRKRILEEYPDEDIIRAILLFYVKEYYSYGLLDLVLSPNITSLEPIVKASLKEKRKHKLSKKEKQREEEIAKNDRDAIKMVSKKMYDTMLSPKAQKNNKLLLGVNKKIMKALGILP